MVPIPSGNTLARLVDLLPRRRRWQFGLVLALTLVGAAAELASIGAVVPFLGLIAAPDRLTHAPLIGGLMRSTGYTTAAQLLVPAAILLVVVALAAAAIRILLTWVNMRFVATITHDLSFRLFVHSLRQPYIVHISRNSSEILSAIDKINQIGYAVLVPGMQAISSAVIAIGIVALLFVIDPFTATTAGLTVGIFYVGLGLYTRKQTSRRSRRYADISTSRVQTVQEALGGVREIILDSSQAVFEQQFSRLDFEFRALAARQGVLVNVPRYAVEGLGIVLIAMLALYFQSQPGGVVAAIPILGALALGAQRLMPLLQNINIGWAGYSALQAMMVDVLTLIEAPIQPLYPRPSSEEIVPLGSEIALLRVTFDYGTDKPALREIDLVIPRGSRIGFVGQTGSGKSTLLDIVMGLLPVTSGAILIDGAPLVDEAIGNWQAQIAHVPQSIFLADDTIAGNIAFGIPPEQIDLTRVKEAAKRADAAEFIDQLAEGYATKVGERGVRLSGGQRQRLGIARALYKRATVLILDEATSALDDATERSVMAGIAALDRELTVLMIAHRVSTLASCDLVVRLDNGRIVAQGSYSEIVGGSGVQVSA